MAQNKFARVILDEGPGKPLDYLLPHHLINLAKTGARVVVSVRTRLCKGTILDIVDHSPYNQVKPIVELLSSESLLTEDCLALSKWISDYYATPLNKVMHLFLPPVIRHAMGAKEQFFVRLTLSQQEAVNLAHQLRRKTAAQARLIEILIDHPNGMLRTHLLKQAETSQSAYAKLCEKKIIKEEKQVVQRDPIADASFVRSLPKTLTDEQQQAVTEIQQAISSATFCTYLLHGITGSGKTEVYLHAISHALAEGHSVIYLVPEIALTPQTVERLKGRFSETIVLFHHRLSLGERRDGWYALQNGSAKIAIGPRSILFCPMPNLGLIIVDEEHDGSYKQTNEMPCYHARDAAVMRAKFACATVVLGSATPSLESYFNVEMGKYHFLTLQHRATQQPGTADNGLPHIQIVDMRHKRSSHLFSGPLLHAIEERYRRGEQMLLFLNRRGYHPQRFCEKCGQIQQCPNCAVALTYYRKEDRLSCHLCGYRISPPPSGCIYCGALEAVRYKGAGTEQVERALHAIFPSLRILRLDRDTTRHKGDHETIFKQFRSGKADLLIGTQMIAKGLHFPSCTFVGVLDADSGLGIPDFRSSERTFQLICQVAGRAGRGDLKGNVIVQTWTPDHYAILHAVEQDYFGFYREEIATRKLLEYPPVSRLVKILATGAEEGAVQLQLEALRKELLLQLPSSYQIEAVIPCGYRRIKNYFRFQFFIRGPSSFHIARLFAGKKLYNQGVNILLDIDPVSTF